VCGGIVDVVKVEYGGELGMGGTGKKVEASVESE
jgi:hypothetical protein